MGRANRLRDRRMMIVNRYTTTTAAPEPTPTPTPTPSPASSFQDQITVNAGQALSGHVAVYINSNGDAVAAGPTSTSRGVIGVTVGAAAQGSPATVQTGGVLVEPSWSWQAGLPVWLAASGGLTQTLPTTGYLFQVGVPAGPTKLRIEPQLIAVLN